jgi:hypothetical protein
MHISILYSYVHQKIKKWLYNHQRTNTCQRITFIHKWSARNIFYHDKKDDIGKLAQEMSRAAPGSQEYIRALQDAMTHFWKQLLVQEEEE